MSKVPPPNTKKTAKKAPPPPRITSVPFPLEPETAIGSGEPQPELAAPKQQANPFSEKKSDSVEDVSKTESEPIQEANIEKITSEPGLQETAEKEIVLLPPPPKKLPIPNKSIGPPRKPNIAPPAPPKARQQKEEDNRAQQVSSPAEESKDVVQQQPIQTIQTEPVKEEFVPHVKIVGVRTPPPPGKGGKGVTKPKPPTNLKPRQDQLETKVEERGSIIENKQIEQQQAKQPILQEVSTKGKQEGVKQTPPAPIESKQIPKLEAKALPKPQPKSIPKPPEVQKKLQIPEDKKQKQIQIPAVKPVETVLADKKDNALANKLEQLRKARQLMKQQQQEQQDEEEQEQEEQSNSVQQYSEGESQQEEEDVIPEKQIKRVQKQPLKQVKIEIKPEIQTIVIVQPVKEEQKIVATEEIFPKKQQAAPQITLTIPIIDEKPVIKLPPPIKALPKNLPKPTQPPKPQQPPKKISNPEPRPEEPAQKIQNPSQTKDLPPPLIQKVQTQPQQLFVVQEKIAINRSIQVSQPPSKEPISLKVKKPEGSEEIERLLEEYRRLKKNYIENLEAFGELSEKQNRQERAAGERVERLLAGLSQLDQQLRERCRVICE